MDEVEFGILGPLTASWAGREIPLGPEKHRTLLACLLLRAGQVVPVAELVDRVWRDDPPAGGRRVVQTYVTRLRKALGAAGPLIRTVPPGYLLEVPEQAFDLARFRAHVERARTAGDLRAEVDELRAGLALWRGEPLADLAPLRDEAPRLVEERMRALDRRIEIDLALGRHAELVGELSGLVREHPLRESLWAQLVLALHRSGRQADALRAYQEVRTLLREELGLDPGEALRRAHGAILRPDSGPGQEWTPVRQLPADTGTFVGREELVERISGLVTGTRPVVLVLSGTAGIGKTALAVRAGYRLADRFPDGQLYVNLRGHSGGIPMSSGDALVRMLRAVGVPPDRIPAELDEQSALFRSTVAGRKILVVLDNAVGPEQVRPLLPGSPSCPVIVTSRDNLRGLIAINGALRLPVDVLSATESVDLLAGIAGRTLIDAEPAAAQQLAELCGRLPLALRIAAANLADGPHRTIREYVEHLAAGDRIGALEIDGDDRSVRVAFGQSYGTLKPDPARLFRLASLIPGADFDAYVAANLAGLSLGKAQTLLDSLASANLIQGGDGRYQFHDLMRAYAVALTREYDTPAERAAAHRRMLSFYCWATDSVAGRVYPEWLRLPVPPAPDGTPLPELDTIASSIGWLDAERGNLVAAVLEPDADPDLGCPLTAALLGYLLTQRHNRECLAAITKVLADAERTGDVRAQAALRFGLGQYRYAIADPEGGRDQMTRSAQLYRQCGDLRGAARSTSKLGLVLMALGERAEAIRRFEETLAEQRAIGDRAGEGLTLMRMGFSYVEHGPLALAVDVLTNARELTEEFGFQIYAMNLAYYRGRALISSGAPDRAIADFDEAIELSKRLRFFDGEAYGHFGLAAARLALGQPEDALADASRAVALSHKVSAHICELDGLTLMGTAELELDRIDDAEADLRQARSLAEQARLPIEAGRVDTLLAACHRRRGDLDLALRTVPAATSGEPWCAPVLTELARIRLAMGDASAAVTAASEAVEIAAAAGYRLDEEAARVVLRSAMKQE